MGSEMCIRDRNKSASRVAAWGVFAFALLFVCADSAFKVDGGCAANKAASSTSRSLWGTSGCPPQNPGHEDPAKYRRNSGLTGGEAVPAEPLGRSAEEVIKLTGGETATADPPGSLMPSLQTLVSNATRQTQVEEETGQLYIPSPTREACYEAREALCHIVQDLSLIHI